MSGSEIEPRGVIPVVNIERGTGGDLRQELEKGG